VDFVGGVEDQAREIVVGGKFNVADAVASAVRLDSRQLDLRDVRILDVVRTINVRNAGFEFQPVCNADANAERGLDRIAVSLGRFDQADQYRVDDLKPLKEEAVL